MVVVGGGASGRQIAWELARARPVSLSRGAGIGVTPQRVLGRDVMVWFDRFGFLRADKASARGRFARAYESFPGRHLRDRSLQRHGVRLKPRTVGATAGGLLFQDGAVERFDTVIWAMGYTDDSHWLAIPEAIDPYGRYLDERGQSPVPGLFYVGRHWQHSRASALLCGVGADAERMVGHVCAWLSAGVVTAAC